ncbi:CHAT domain-containing protein [Cyclobacterium xiamenense]|uniref:CHAT domain-containing protein n=1 Tax=Cyclobacterium xiamenense TaxID=1297121 RepID=A0A1H7BBJ5_9BACT|nr:CHAT domain-containing protein [Cyclobacterium xiamenense]SEJ73647.1 CHAT domain-containing protein [Cyclobacterium xiamenense]
MGQESDWLEKYEAAVAYFYAEVPDAKTDSSAMHLFQGIIEAQADGMVPDTVLLDAYEKLGTLFLIQNAPEKSIQTLKKGILTARKNNLLDSLLFHSYLFMGENFFLMNQADSSIFYLNRAEAALRTKADKNETGRLYNSLGVIYYESGNYTQAVNYFSKAKSALLEDRSLDNSTATEYALFSLLSNEAAAWTNLNAFTKAADLYTQALELTIDRDEIMRKLAALYVEKNAPDTALYYLQQTEQQAAAGNRLHQNILADIYLLTNQPDKVIDLLQDAATKEMNPGTNTPTANNYRNGESFQLLGKAWHQKKQYKKALQSFHLALLSFDESFQQTDVFQNPTPGNVNWGMTDLFETLLLKAETAGLLAKETQEVSLHRLSFHTYQTAFDLVFYMNNLYDNEEARIFLGEAVRKGYESAVAAAIDRYKQTNDPNDLIQGFSWAEESKATALELARNEARIKEKAGIPPELLQQEKNLKFQLTRANRQLMENYSPKRAEELEAAVRDSKLALSRLYASYNDFTVYFSEKIAAERIEFSVLQSHVNSNNLAVLSYFFAADDIFCFTLTPQGLKLAESSEKATVTSTIRTLQSSVLNSRGNSRKDLESAATKAFQQVIAAAYREIEDYRDWIILPDQILVHVPFDMMLDPAGQFLVENHALSYLYSGKFLHEDSEKPAGGQTLGFAPFTGQDSMPHPAFEPLPYSGSEIDVLAGLAFTGQSATKTEFLKHSESASLIHLATHAFSSSKPGTDPFIVFSPAETDHLLYAEELYQLNLQNTSLVFLSACQTHTGTLIASEGLISLSRAFSYAGCSNLVSSIWKANDKTTAYISQEFYRWVDRGYSFPVALQRAKNALRNDPEMAQFHHPYYWANLVFIGNRTEPSPAWIRFWYLSLLPAPIILAWWLSKKSPGKPGLFNR